MSDAVQGPWVVGEVDADPADRRTGRERVGDVLRERILAGELAPGERIDLDKYAAEFGTSRTPVREACLALAQDGLVKVVQRSGVTVIGVTPESTIENFQLMAALSGVAAQWASGKISERDLLRVKELQREIRIASQAGEDITTLNWLFHAAINRAEDFIYIETPALDDLSLGDTGDTLQLWQALIARMTARPALRVILCVPVFLAAGAPKALQRVRERGSLVVGVYNEMPPFHAGMLPSLLAAFWATSMICRPDSMAVGPPPSQGRALRAPRRQSLVGRRRVDGQERVLPRGPGRHGPRSPASRRSCVADRPAHRSA